MPGPGLLVLDHPVVADRLSRLRDAGTGSAEFRQVVHDLSLLVAYEALRDLSTGECRVETPVATASCRRIDETVLLVPVLRAGLGMVPAVQGLLPRTEVAHVGLRRDEATLEAEVYLDRLPGDLRGRRVVICDPMLATGGSLSRVCSLVVARGAGQVQALCLIASAPGLRTLGAAHPGVPVACAAVDPELDGHGFIVPGLGDAGDRLFGPPG
ncbi:MAG: uracil phosphoribosyltransferase [Acidimicrobiales bacterium]